MLRKAAGAMLATALAAGCAGDDDVGGAEPSSVAVPDLVGEPFEDARQLVGDAGLRTERPLKLELCEEPAPTDVVRRQDPRAGARIAAGRVVEIYTHCSIEPCQGSELRLTVGGEPGLTSGGAFVSVTIEHRRDAPCELTSLLEVLVTDHSGDQVESMKPFVRPIPYRLGRRGVVSGDIGWSSWCEGRESVQLSAALAGLTAHDNMEPPLCNGGSTSSLYPLRQSFNRWLYSQHQAAAIH